MQIWMDPMGKLRTGPKHKFRFRELILERGNHFRWLPRYRVVVHSDARVEWEGKSAVVEIGRKEWQLSTDQVDALQATLEKAPLHKLTHSSERFVDQAPLPTIRVIFKDGTEIVGNSLDTWPYTDVTAELVRRFNSLADAIDHIAGTAPLVYAPYPADRRTMRILTLTLERGPCYGTCPMYAVNVDRDGRVDWIGERWVEAEGERSWNVSQEMVEKLRQTLVRAKFTDFQDCYDGSVTDQSSATITVQFLDGVTKRVYHYHGYWDSSPEALDTRKRLHWLENRIDRLLGTKEYIGNRR